MKIRAALLLLTMTAACTPQASTHEEAHRCPCCEKMMSAQEGQKKECCCKGMENGAQCPMHKEHGSSSVAPVPHTH